MSRLVLAVVVGAFTGCGGGTTGKKNVNYTVVRAMGSFYSRYLDEHKSQTPPNEQAFRKYLETKQDGLQKSGLTVDKMFLSPRNNEPLEWVYGKALPTGAEGMTFFAYEKAPVEGQRLVIANRGMYEIMDEAKFHTVFPNAQ